MRPYEMAQRLLAKGHTVTIVCGSYSGGHTGLIGPFSQGRRRGLSDGIDVVEFDLAYSNQDKFIKRAFTFLKFALRSLVLALTEEYDLVFATSTPLTAGIPGIFARWLRRKPFVFEVRDLWPDLPKAMGVIRNPLMLTAMSFLEWVSYRSAHRLIGLAPGIVDGIARRGVAREKIALIPNGCDIGLFSSAEAPWRPEGVGEEDLMAVFAGTHGIANGLDAVLDVAVELQHRGRSDIKIVLIGQGKLKASLQQRAEKEDLKNVIFHAPVEKNRLAGLLAAADLGLQILADVPAFYYGTSPNKFFDYIAAGLAVLNNYPGWIAEIIEKKHCGFVVPPRDPIAFVDAMEKASENRVALREMGNNSLQLAKNEFDRGMQAERFVEWIERAVR